MRTFGQWIDVLDDKTPGMWHTTGIKTRMKPEKQEMFSLWFKKQYAGFDYKLNPTYAGFGRLSIKVPPEKESDDVVKDIEDDVLRKWAEDFYEW